MSKTKSVRRRKPSSGPVILSIMAVLYLFGLFGLMWFAASKLVDYLKENVQVTAYFSIDSPESDQKQVLQTIESWPEVLRVAYISPEEAASQFKEDLGENFVEVIGSNPLPASIQVFLKSSADSKTQLSLIQTELEALNGIYEVVAQNDLIDSIDKNRKVISYLILSLLVLFVFIAILLINNTVRLSVYSKRFLIRSMQLVGATEWFITRPFVAGALLNGLIGGLIASFLYLATAYAAGSWLQNVVFNDSIVFFDWAQVISNASFYLLLICSGLVLGMFIAGLSTYISTRKYIYSRIDDLY